MLNHSNINKDMTMLEIVPEVISGILRKAVLSLEYAGWFVTYIAGAVLVIMKNLK